VLGKCPRISGINPVNGLIGGALQRDATTVSRDVAWCNDFTDDDVLVFNVQRLGVDDRLGAVDRQVALNNDVVVERCCTCNVQRARDVNVASPLNASASCISLQQLPSGAISQLADGDLCGGAMSALTSG
jgi:hypothetical protein